MLYICDDDPNLVELVSKTKMAYVSIDESVFFYITANKHLAKGSLRYGCTSVHLKHCIPAEEILQNLSAKAILITKLTYHLIDLTYTDT